MPMPPIPMPPIQLLFIPLLVLLLVLVLLLLTIMEKYELLQKIGRGSFGLIRKIKRKSDGKV